MPSEPLPASTVLVADRNPAVRAPAIEALREAGYADDEAADLPAVLEFVHANPPTVVVLDAELAPPYGVMRGDHELRVSVLIPEHAGNRSAMATIHGHDDIVQYHERWCTSGKRLGECQE